MAYRPPGSVAVTVTSGGTGVDGDDRQLVVGDRWPSPDAVSEDSAAKVRSSPIRVAKVVRHTRGHLGTPTSRDWSGMETSGCGARLPRTDRDAKALRDGQAFGVGRRDRDRGRTRLNAPNPYLTDRWIQTTQQ